MKMKNEIKFNFFEEETTIYFNMKRLRDLEIVSGKPLGIIINSPLDLGILVSALQIGLLHKYGTRKEDFYFEKITNYLNQEGCSLVDIWQVVVRALMASGTLGVKFAEKAMAVDKLGEIQEGEKIEENEGTEQETKN